ncbi:MAG: hypothetical protein A2Z14_02720 [Chloroflexi bacterium RBG_16_48_8]|nr:MAG: hypothetical protein A2Z14_02720 [Chloroflexi bacterium RBG_16_48_8]
MNLKWKWILLIALVPTLFACTSPGDSLGTETPSGKVYKKDVTYVDFDSSEIIVLESYPVQVEVVAKGDLPTPCHEIKWEVSAPDENKAIHISIYSEVESGIFCAQFLEPFVVRIPLGDFEEVGYSVWINDYEVGGF